MELRRLFASFIIDFIHNSLASKAIKILYATPPLLFVLSAPPLHCITSVPSVTLCALLCKCFSLSLHILDESVISGNRAINSFLKLYKTSSTICFQIAEDVLSFLNFLYISLCFYTEKRLKKGVFVYLCKPLAIKKLRSSVSKGA